MKIGAISDIHLDVNEGYPVIEAICDRIRAEKLDCLLVAGDISNSCQTSMISLDRLSEEAGIPVWFVPGNHDMWDKEGEFGDARKIYEKYASRRDCLCGKITELNEEWVVVGNIGWYDYSFGASDYSEEEFQKKEHNGRVWQDSIMVKWHQSDKEFHKKILQDLEEKMKACKGKKIIVVTHMVGVPEFKVPSDRPDWDYFNAFLGSKEYGELFEKYKVAYSIMGHVHYRKALIKNGVDYRCVCLNYHTEWQSGELATEVGDAMQVIEV